jgi:hypothetical protein
MGKQSEGFDLAKYKKKYAPAGRQSARVAKHRVFV